MRYVQIKKSDLKKGKVCFYKQVSEDISEFINAKITNVSQYETDDWRNWCVDVEIINTGECKEDVLDLLYIKI